MERFLLVAIFLLGAGVSRAQVDTIRIDRSGDKPVLYLRDSSLAPGVASASASDSLAIVRYGPEPSAETEAGSRMPTQHFPAAGLLWIVGIVTATLSAFFVWLGAKQQQRTRLELWRQRSERRRQDA
ncbi:MAG: hypothetical protein AAGI52_16625 [Bacteroidota bacterium]